MKVLEGLDPELLGLIEKSGNLALSDNVLPKRFKLLIAMALDASLGAVQGVKRLTQSAMKAGATKEEVIEALRVAEYITGAGSVYAAAQALRIVRN